MPGGGNRLSQRTSDSRGGTKKSGSTRRLFSKTTRMQEGKQPIIDVIGQPV